MPITREMIQAEYNKSETQASLEQSVETALNSSKDFQEKHALNTQDLDSLSNTLLSRWTSTLYGKLVIDGKIINSEEEITETQAKKQIDHIIKAKDADGNSNFKVLISKKVQDVVAQASKAKQLQAEADRAPLDNLMTKAIEDSLESIINDRVANKIKAKETQWESKDNSHVRFMLIDAIRNNVPQQRVVKQITDFLDKQTAILRNIPNLGQAALEKAQPNALVQPQGAQEQPTVAVAESPEAPSAPNPELSEAETIQKIIDFMAQPFALLVKQQAEILLQQKKTEWDKNSTIAVIKLLMPQVKKQFPQSDKYILLAFQGRITHQNMIALATPLLKKNVNLAQDEPSVGPEPKANSAEVLQPPSVQLREPEAPSLDPQQPAAPEAENPKENIENDAVLAQRLQREEQSARDEAQRRKEEEEAASLAFIHQQLSQEEAQAAGSPAIDALSPPIPAHQPPAPVLPADVEEDPDFEMALALSLSEEQQREAQEREAQKKPLTFASSSASPRAPTSTPPSTPAPAAAAPQAPVPHVKAKTPIQSLESYIITKKDEAKAGKLHKGSFYGKSNQVEKLNVAEQALSTLQSTGLTDETKLTAIHRYLKANQKHTGIAVFHNHGGELAHILESAKSDLTSRLSNQPYKAVFAELEAYVQEAEQNYTSLHSGLSVGSFMIKSNQIEKLKIAQDTLYLRGRLEDSNNRVSPAINRALEYLIKTKETVEGSINKNTALTAGSNPLHSKGQLHSILENLKNEIETEINNLKTAPLPKHS